MVDPRGFQRELGPCQDVPGGQQGFGFGEAGFEVEESFVRKAARTFEGEVQKKVLHGVERHGWQHAPFNFAAIDQHAPRDVYGGGAEAVFAGSLDRSAVGLAEAKLKGLLHLLGFQHVGLGRTVGHDQAIVEEVVVARGALRTVVSAIGKEGTASLFCLPQSLVLEVPDEAAPCRRGLLAGRGPNTP